jgi:polyphosphate glucokinase
VYDVNDTVLGIDIGGSGMKAAPVDVANGVLLADRFRIATPQPANPAAMTQTVAALVDHFAWSGPIGCAFPGVIRRRSIVETAANLCKTWIGVNGAEQFGTADTPITMINDADAAGLAEMRFGSGRGHEGVVFMLTIGTGLGTALFNDGRLVPNTELGHIEIEGVEAEARASSRAKKAEDLSMEVWAKRLELYLGRIEDLLSPDLFVIGGGISKDFDEFAPLIETRAPMLPAAMRNHAGIVGAAMAVAAPEQTS